MKQIWKDLKNTNYSVSNEGHVLNKTTGRILKPRLTQGRYAYTLRILGESEHFYAHTLVAIVFLKFNRADRTKLVKHKDGNMLNNQLKNLVITSCRRRNIDSMRRGKTSTYTGVSFDKKKGKWVANISANGKRKYLGCFENEEDGNKAYQEELAKII